jgi:hypothetical protein
MTRVSGVSRALTLATSVALAGCGPAGRPPNASLDAVERVRSSPAAKEAERTAPQAIAEADAERRKADEALASGDETTAGIYAERALVGVEHAIVLGRLARASEGEREARARAERALAEARELAATRARLDAENAELEKKLKIAHELSSPPVSGAADPKRDAARRVAADSLLAQARLLCGAARLVAKGQASNELDEAEKAVAAKPPAAAGTAIDAAARARAGCLAALTRFRRQTPTDVPGASGAASAAHPDALLSDLTGTGHFDASRDERGVVVTLHDAFDGGHLKADAERSLTELGKILGQNAKYRAQVVVHDATRRDDGDTRATGAAGVLAKAAGLADKDIDAENAATRLPLVDPTNAKLRARNARLDVVFISPTN